jgi:two-component system sensor histidine kinase UhpB
MLNAFGSLRARLIVSIASVLVMALVVGGILVYLNAVREVDVELRAALSVGENTVRNSVDDVEEALSPLRHLQLLVDDFNGDRHVRASLITPDDQVLYRSTPLTPEQPAPEWFYRLLAPKRIHAHLELPAPFNQFGAVQLEADPRNEISEVWDAVTVTLAILVAFGGLNAGLVLWVTARALRPLEAISAAFSQLGAGNYGLRIEEQGPRELARLCSGFNAMAAQLTDAEERRDRLERQLAAVQDEERSELARDLHDEIGPLLFAVSVDLSVIQQDEAIRHSPIAPRIESVRESMACIYRDIKAILGRLRPATPVDFGLMQAIENLVSFWRTRYPEVVFRLQAPSEGFGSQIDDTIYHIIKESLSNALRHGQPTHISISVLAEEHQLIATISDNGIGLTPKANAQGFGLIGMDERVRCLDGTLSVENSALGTGVVVTARLPLSVAPGLMRTTLAQAVES